MDTDAQCNRNTIVIEYISIFGVACSSLTSTWTQDQNQLLYKNHMAVERNFVIARSPHVERSTQKKGHISCVPQTLSPFDQDGGRILNREIMLNQF